MTSRAIDCWVNVNMGAMGRPDYLEEVAANYFKQGEDFFATSIWIELESSFCGGFSPS